MDVRRGAVGVEGAAPLEEQQQLPLGARLDVGQGLRGVGGRGGRDDVWLLLEVGDAGLRNLRVCVRKEHGVGGSSCSGVRLQLDGEAEGDGLEVVPGQSVTFFH